MYKLIQKIGIDRIAHFGIGAFIVMFCIFAFSWWGIYPVVVNGLILPFVAAMYKEGKDVANGGKFDKWDVIATMIGAIMMIGVFLFLTL